MQKLIIAIDGPVGSGKSTVARRVAELLGYIYLDSGAMYRAVAWKALRDGVPLDAEEMLTALARATRIDLVSDDGGFRVLVDRTDVTDPIRSAAVAQAASKVAVNGGVRTVLVAEQRRAAACGGVVMEGRDIGTVVFPQADAKIFLDAAPEVRGMRRFDQLGPKPAQQPEEVIRDLRERDRRDRNRADSPLMPAEDAVLLDSTNMTLEEAVAAAEEIVADRILRIDPA